MPSPLADVLRHPTALLPRRHIFLLSHMRAYSSLLGHIFGSNPGICGYYEMHIGYHSWKSLVRQKLLYFRDEPVKPGSYAMFDKVLHNDHAFLPAVMNHPRVSTVFTLRPPEQTVPSIVRLYQNIEPTHEFAGGDFSAVYYTERLLELERLALNSKKGFMYFDAEALKTNTERTLDTLTHWLALDTPLTPEYELQKKTAAQRYGDSSPAMRSGRIEQGGGDYDTQGIDPELLSKATSTYRDVRARLITLCEERVLDEELD